MERMVVGVGRVDHRDPSSVEIRPSHSTLEKSGAFYAVDDPTPSSPHGLICIPIGRP